MEYRLSKLNNNLHTYRENTSTRCPTDSNFPFIHIEVYLEQQQRDDDSCGYIIHLDTSINHELDFKIASLFHKEICYIRPLTLDKV